MKNKNNLIFLHKVLKSIADSIIKVFIPLYILKVTNNLNLSMFYLGAYSFMTIIFMLLLKKFLYKYGVIAIILHCLPTILCQLLLTFFELNYYNVLLCSMLMGLSQTLYSIPLNLIFAFGDKKVNVGKFEIASNVGKLFFIVFSGFVLSSDVKNSVLLLSIISGVFYILCVIPIRFSYSMLKSNFEKIANSHNETKLNMKNFNIFHIAFGCFQSTMEVCVPLYLYINNLSFEAITTVIALIEFLKIVANNLGNFMIKKNKHIVCCSISFAIFILSITGLMIFKNPTILYVLSCLTSVSFPLTFVPMFSTFCKKIKEDNSVFNEMKNRDVYIFIGKLPLSISYFPISNLYCSFVFGIVSSLTMYFEEIKILKKIKKY